MMQYNISNLLHVYLVKVMQYKINNLLFIYCILEVI